MIKRLGLITFAVFLLGAGVITAAAQQWVDLGTKEVKDRSEQDTWHVGKDHGEFHRIKIGVGNKAVRFYRLRVTFGNGGTQEIELRNVIQAGGESRAIDLTGNDRHIDKVDIWYEAYTARRGKRSSVTLWGIR
jgi:hypothetical protein